MIDKEMDIDIDSLWPDGYDSRLGRQEMARIPSRPAETPVPSENLQIVRHKYSPVRQVSYSSGSLAHIP